MGERCITYIWHSALLYCIDALLWKCCTQYASKFGKLSSGHGTGKGQFSFQSQRKAMPKNAQTTTQLYSSHRLVTGSIEGQNRGEVIETERLQI